MYFGFGELYGWTSEEVSQMTLAQAEMYQRDPEGKHTRPGVTMFKGKNAQRRALQYAAGRR